MLFEWIFYSFNVFIVKSQIFVIIYYSLYALKTYLHNNLKCLLRLQENHLIENHLIKNEELIEKVYAIQLKLQVSLACLNTE